MTGKLLTTLVIALLAQVCLGQNAFANLQVRGNFENLGAQLGAKVDDKIGNGIQVLQNGAATIGSGLNGISQQVQEYVRNAIAKASAAASEAQEKVAKLLADVQARAQAAASSAAKHVDEAIASAKQAAADARQRAEALGQATSQCVGEEVDLEALRSRTIGLITDCVKEKLQEASDIVNRIRDSANDAKQAAANLDTTISVECNGLNSNSLLRCKGNVASQSGGQLLVDAKNIATAVNDARRLIQTIKVDLEICTAKNAAQAALDAGKVAVKIADCISQAENKH